MKRSIIEGEIVKRMWAIFFVNPSFLDNGKGLPFIKDILNDVIRAEYLKDWFLVLAGEFEARIATVGWVFVRDPKGEAYVWALSTASRNTSSEQFVNG